MSFQISLAYSKGMQQLTIKSAVVMSTAVLNAFSVAYGLRNMRNLYNSRIPLPRNPGLEKLARIQGLGFSTAIRCTFMCLDTKDNDNRTPLSWVATVELGGGIMQILL